MHSGYVFVAAVTRDGEAGGGATSLVRCALLQLATTIAGNSGGVGAATPNGIARLGGRQPAVYGGGALRSRSRSRNSHWPLASTAQYARERTRKEKGELKRKGD